MLLLEDDTSVIQLLESHLMPAGFETIETRDVRTAWKSTQEDPPDAVIVDLVLPGVYGWEFVERMRRESRFIQTPVIILSGHLGPDEIRRAEELGCEWMEKPFNPDQLLAKLHSMIRHERWVERRRQKVRLFTDALVIEGFLYLAPHHARFSDGLEELMQDGRRFLPLTNARISSLGGTLLTEFDFCEIAKADVQGIAPVEDN